MLRTYITNHGGDSPATLAPRYGTFTGTLLQLDLLRYERLSLETNV